jgi:hypothetical protein
MILSFILHGNIPYYDPDCPHPDPVLHEKLKHRPDLLHLDISRLTDHFEASRFSYSTQALPVNSLLDALVRPGGETEDAEGHTCVRWRRMPHKAVSHLVLGDAPRPGGQWTECPAGTKWHIQSLSYAGMLSLPGYTFHEHHRRTQGVDLPAFTRPTRQEISEYLAAYPAAVGISDTFHCAQSVAGVTRCEGGGFSIGSHGIHCKRLVLASGIFSEPKIARPLLQPLLKLEGQTSRPPAERPPLLVIGSGFSAADIIISAPPDQKIIHIFKWAPDSKPSPLKACHQHAYPEYAGVYRLMKRAAMAKTAAESSANRPLEFRPRTLTPFLKSRTWNEIYEGLPNTMVTDVSVNGSGAVVTLRTHNGATLTREVSGLAYAVGRRGSLKCLDKSLLRQIIDETNDQDDNLISSRTLRNRVLRDLEVAKDVFVVGSLTGDSLIRFAYGSCVFVAGKIIALSANQASTDEDAAIIHVRGTEAPRVDQIPASDGGGNRKCRGQLRRNRGSYTSDVSKPKPGKMGRLWASCFF